MLQQSGIADVIILIGACVRLVRAQFVKKVRLETKSEPRKPLLAYEHGSLSALEVRILIRIKVGVELTTPDIIDVASLKELAK